MITASDIYVQYGDRIVLNRVNLVIGEKDKVGLVGRNGAGKSTLLKIIAEEVSPHEGKISRPGSSTLGFLHQEMDIPKGKTILDECLTAFAEVKALEAKVEQINQELAERTDYESDEYHQLIADLANYNEQFLIIGGQSMEAEVEKVLKGLGFRQKDFQRLVDEFSGGWQMRVELAKMLLRRPSYLLLDEPTNHLDIESIIWLESFLQDYPGAVVVISHDKEFLNNVTTRTVEVEHGKLYDYKAPYLKFVELQAERREKQRAAYENQQRVIADRERTINRFMAKATKTKMAQSMQRQLDKMERIEVEEADRSVMNLRFPDAPRSGQIVVEGNGIVKKYCDLLVLNGVNINLERGEKMAFVGQNGQGKTTLAKILINHLSYNQGSVKLGHNVSIGYYAQNQSEALDSKMTVLQTMEQEAPPEMRTQVRHILGAFMFSGEDADKKVSVLSGGERARLALACLLLRPFNFLVLDEPTNHLDILSKDVLKQALQQYNGSMIVVSHDREFLAGLTDKTIEFRDHQLFEHLGDVNTFLEKRRLDSMRDVEKRTGNGAPAEAPAPDLPELSYEERKKLLRAVSNAEKKIERLESLIADMEKRMTDPAFYDHADTPAKMQEYGQWKADLEAAMEEWAQAQEILEKHGA